MRGGEHKTDTAPSARPAAERAGPVRRSLRSLIHPRAAGRPGAGPAAASEEVSLDDLVVITGLSGAGKSEAMNCFEDAGYFCVDNLPPAMLASLSDLLTHSGSKVERAAVVCDVRGGTYFEGLEGVLTGFEQRGFAYRLLFLDCDSHVLVNRFKETRRRHPLASGGAVIDGIERERELLRPIREHAEFVIDTTELSSPELRRRIIAAMLPPETRGKLAVTFMTFGFKHGIPRDVDLTFDVRFLPNPHYVDALRPLTGRDAPVREYVEACAELTEFYDRLTPLLDYLLPAYAAEGKAHLTVGIGCTGGRHRSVVVAEHLTALYAGRDEWSVAVRHRDIGLAAR